MRDCRSVSIPIVESAVKYVAGEDGELLYRTTYQQFLGCLLFVATRTHREISTTVGIFCRYAAATRHHHCTCLKRILRYRQGTMTLSLRLVSEGSGKLVCFCDSDWAGERLDEKSTPGVLMQFDGVSFSWRTVKQNSVALWLDCTQQESAPLTEENQGELVWSTERLRHAKHVSISYDLIIEHVDDGVIMMVYSSTKRMTADIPTKPISRVALKGH